MLIVFLFMCTMLGGTILLVIVLQECRVGDVGGGDVISSFLISFCGGGGDGMWWCFLYMSLCFFLATC